METLVQYTRAAKMQRTSRLKSNLKKKGGGEPLTVLKSCFFFLKGTFDSFGFSTGRGGGTGFCVRGTSIAGWGGGVKKEQRVPLPTKQLAWPASACQAGQR